MNRAGGLRRLLKYLLATFGLAAVVNVPKFFEVVVKEHVGGGGSEANFLTHFQPDRPPP